VRGFAPIWVAIASVSALAPPAHAEEPSRIPTAVLLPTFGSPDLEGFAGAVERVLRKEIDGIDTVDTSATPALDLAAIQLAVGCVAENDDCLRDVAAQLGTPVLIATQVDKAGDSLVVSILKFDTRSVKPRLMAIRRAEGEQRESQLLSDVPFMVDELYGRKRPEPTIVPPLAAQTIQPEPMPVWPWAVAGAGGALLITGMIVGAISNGTESDFAAKPTNTAAEVDEALLIYDRADTQSTIANVFLIGGAVVTIGGVIAAVLTWPAAPAAAPTGTPGPNGRSMGLVGSFGGETW
jgi:hypothetical protein